MGKETKVNSKKPAAQQPEGSLYSRSELIEAAFAFSVKPETMAGALKLDSKSELTKAEAKKAVKNYLERKV